MKAIKITLAVVVLAVISFFVIRSLESTDTVELVNESENPFISKIENDIRSLRTLPNDTFSKESYNNINYEINTFHSQGRFGNNTSENDQWKKNLTSTLYAAYSDKFIKEAFYVFNNSDWKVSDLRFIRQEYQDLRNSHLLERGSPIDRKFSDIAAVFSKYDEIVGFISQCNSFSYTDYGLSDKFPISDVEDKVAKANSYLSSNLGNQYVKNCTRLRGELEKIPKNLFWKHVNYLDNKLDGYIGRYPDLPNHSLYSSSIYRPLKSEIDVLYSNAYSTVHVSGAHSNLMTKLNTDSSNAYNHFSK